VPWREGDPGSSPESWAEGIFGAAARLHWFVHTMASPVALRVVRRGGAAAGATGAGTAAATAGGDGGRGLRPVGAAPGPPQAAARREKRGAASGLAAGGSEGRQLAAPRPPAGSLQARGWLHAEKNWGAAFSDAYFWAQGLSADGKARAAPHDKRVERGGGAKGCWVVRQATVASLPSAPGRPRTARRVPCRRHSRAHQLLALQDCPQPDPSRFERNLKLTEI
jgi:hypothetical protein